MLKAVITTQMLASAWNLKQIALYLAVLYSVLNPGQVYAQIPVAVTVDRLLTNDTSPALSGTFTGVVADLNIAVDGNVYEAGIFTSGVWTVLDDMISLALHDGEYDILVEATDMEGHIVSELATKALKIDTVAQIHSDRYSSHGCSPY